MDALWEERRLIEENRERTINRLRPCVSNEDQKEYRRNYYEKHYQEIQMNVKEYRDRHKEQAKIYNTEYRKQHKEALKTYYAEKVPCDVCGNLCSRTNMARHKRKSCVPPSE